MRLTLSGVRRGWRNFILRTRLRKDVRKAINTAQYTWLPHHYAPQVRSPQVHRLSEKVNPYLHLGPTCLLPDPPETLKGPLYDSPLGKHSPILHLLNFQDV